MSLLANPSNKNCIMYVIPAHQQLMYVAEVMKESGMYMDDILTFAITLLERRYERHIEDILYDELYDYYVLVNYSLANGTSDPNGRYAQQTIHEVASVMANNTMSNIMAIAAALSPLLEKVWEHGHPHTLNFNYAGTHKEDLVLIYDIV